MTEEKRWHIFFDAAHQERAKLDSNYTNLKKHLEEQGWICVSFAEFPITRQNLAAGDILVFACPDFSKVSPQEIDAIKHWVQEDGGGLLLLSHAGGDKGRRSNLSEVAEQFGMMFENDQVLDRTNNLGVENLPIIDQFPIPHPIIEGISSLCYRAGCSLTNTGVSNSPVISSGPDAEPFNTPLILAGEYGDGRVITIGSYEMFRDKITGGIKHEGHTQLATNIFKWLQSSKRESIIQKVATPARPAAFPTQGSNLNVVGNDNTSAAPNIMIPGEQVAMAASIVPQISFQSSFQLSSKADVTQAFQTMMTAFDAFKERMLAEFETVKKNMQNLMNTVLEGCEISSVEGTKATPPPVETPSPKITIEDQIPDFGIAAASSKTPVPPTNSPPPNINLPPGLSLPPGLKPPPGASKPISTPVPVTSNAPELSAPITPTPPVVPQANIPIIPSTAEGLQPLSPLPSRPGMSMTPPAQSAPSPSYSQPSYDWSASPAPIQESGAGWGDVDNTDASDGIETPSVPMATGNSSADLQAELSNLEKKMVSIGELRIFVQKKFEGGKIDKLKYDKQIKKLESDIAKTKYRIEEIKGILKK